MVSKYSRGQLTEDEVFAAYGIFTDEDLKRLKETPLYKNWEKTGKIAWPIDENLELKVS